MLLRTRLCLVGLTLFMILKDAVLHRVLKTRKASPAKYLLHEERKDSLETAVMKIKLTMMRCCTAAPTACIGILRSGMGVPCSDSSCKMTSCDTWRRKEMYSFVNTTLNSPKFPS